MSIQDPGNRPTGWGVAGDHERRIRALEALVPCCEICDQVESRLDFLIPGAGELTFWYRMGDIFEFTGDVITPDVLHDSSGFPLPVGSVPHELDYIEDNNASGWDISHRPTLGDFDHPEIGVADDGCIHFNFRQTHFPADGEGFEPGCYFRGDTNGLSSFAAMGGGNSAGQPVGKEMHTLNFYFKIDSDAPDVGYLLANLQVILFVGGGGWAIAHSKSGPTETINFTCTEAGFSPSVGLQSPPIERETWYMLTITRDESTSPATYRMYLNGLEVDSEASVRVDHGYNDWTHSLYIANAGGGSRDSFFKGRIDEIAGYTDTLDPDILLSFYGATGAPTGMSGQTIVCNGDGGTTFSYPTIEVLQDGV